MIDLPDQASQLAMLNQPLRDLVAGRVNDAAALGLAELTRIVVINQEDDLASITDALGFNPLFSRLDDTLAEPDWDWLELHEGWFELVYTFGNDGYAMILFVGDDGGPLALMCRS